jgi:hypothetical protein
MDIFKLRAEIEAEMKELRSQIGETLLKEDGGVKGSYYLLYQMRQQWIKVEATTHAREKELAQELADKQPELDLGPNVTIG